MSWFPNARHCPCGSGLVAEEVHDARGIYLARCCDCCRGEKLAGFRPEVLSDPAYECDEPVETEDGTGFDEIDF